MKETSNKERTLEQKIYMTLLGVGIAALAGLTILYGVQSRKNTELVEQNIQISEQNPVSGQVAVTENEFEKMTQVDEPVEVEPIEENKIVKTNSNAYNGIDKISWPVTGNILIPYSMDTTVYFETLDQYQCNPALFIKADTGTQVKASYGGVVTKVENNDRYGQIITIDMGNGYKASYGQLKDIPYKKGDQVETGAVVGKIAEPTNYFILEGSHLYMKMMKDSKAINPTDYFTP